MKNFVLIGAAGYIAPKHIDAIYNTGNKILAAYDPNDSVGILDSHDFGIKFFTEFERFDRHCCKLIRSGEKIDYVSICSPNYLHDAHIRFALRIGADAICEKPIVLNPWNLDAIEEMEEETGKKVYTILQLRLHRTTKLMMKENLYKSMTQNVNIHYSSPRGEWYDVSWKGDKEKSGGIITNIGVHLFDLAIYLFGEPIKWIMNGEMKDLANGEFYTNSSHISWFLTTKPRFKKERYFIVSDRRYDFDKGFEDLHTLSYKRILEGKGFGIKDTRASIEFVSRMRQ